MKILLTLASFLALVQLGQSYPCSSSGQIKCTQGSCISTTSLCDGRLECSNGEDEDEEFCKAYKDSLCSRGQVYEISRRRCRTWYQACSDSNSSPNLNSTMCTAILMRRFPKKPAPLPKPPAPSVSEEDILAFLKLVNSSTPEPNSCPMFYNNVSGVCASFLPFKMPWSEAIEACRSIDGHLAQRENMKFIRLVTHLTEKGYSSDFWIGGFYDILYDDWRWHSGDKMPLGTPYWALSYKSTCEKRFISDQLGSTEECFHYHQHPLESSAGQCVALDYKNLYFMSSEDCGLTKKPICLHNFNH